MSSDYDDEDDDDWGDDDAHDAVHDVGDILDLFRAGKRDDAVEQFFARDWGAGPDRMFNHLITEANDLFLVGDVDEAMHRLRLAAEPKWLSVTECRDQYDVATAEKHRVGEVA